VNKLGAELGIIKINVPHGALKTRIKVGFFTTLRYIDCSVTVLCGSRLQAHAL